MYLKKTFNSLLIRILTAITLTLNPYSIQAQIFDFEQNPPSLKWYQINTENFQVVYPSPLENEAQRMASTLEKLIPAVSSSLHKQPRKISIFLQNQGTVSNGFVALAPRRSEFFTTPPQEFDHQDWLNSLAVHELRHVVQFDKLTGRYKPPFLEGLALAIFGITLPPWFYEGDAVGIETALTSAGRGRQAEWNLAFRTNTLSGKKYSYSKDYLGSLKDITPGYYQLGYYLTTKLRRDEGGGVLDSLYTRMSANPVRPYNFSNSVKKITGLTTAGLHEKTVSELEGIWRKQLHEISFKSYPTLLKRSGKLTEHYLLPTPLQNGEGILFLKQGKAEAPKIMLRDTSGKIREIIKTGLQEEPHFSYAVGKIAWDELRYDLRYQKRSFNVINSYDLATRTYRQLTHKSRFFAPALSPDGSRIIAVEISYANDVALVELDAQTGKELKRYGCPENHLLQTPAFHPSGEKVVVTAVSQSGKTFLELDLQSGIFRQLLPFQQQLLSRPVYAEGQIVFKADYNDIDNLYRLDTETGKIQQLTYAAFGIYNPAYDAASHTLYFNQYQVKGQDIASLSFNPAMGTAVKEAHPSGKYIEPVVAQEGNRDIFSSPIALEKHPVKPYREISNLFYFHSLVPVVEENNYDDYNIGLQLQSNNKLNTLSFYTGYRFNNALKKSEYFSGFTYGRFYPILDLSYTNQARLAYRRTGTETAPVFIPVDWRENVINTEITIPFTFNQRNHVYRTGFKTGTAYTQRYLITNEPENFIRALHFPMRYKVYFSHTTLRSVRDLAPRWAQNFSLTYRHLPFEKKTDGELLSLESNFYFPGIAPNHSLQVSFNYQAGNGTYALVNDIPYVSGYHFLKPEELHNTLLIDYRFPLFYPDWELGPLAYIKRIKSGFFADFQNIGKGKHFSPASFGLELRADMNLLRFYLPNFDIGGKIIFLNEKSRQNPIFESVISYNF